MTIQCQLNLAVTDISTVGFQCQRFFAYWLWQWFQ